MPATPRSVDNRYGALAVPLAPACTIEAVIVACKRHSGVQDGDADRFARDDREMHLAQPIEARRVEATSLCDMNRVGLITEFYLLLRVGNEEAGVAAVDQMHEWRTWVLRFAVRVCGNFP